jgi:hypothetical protein
MKRTFTLDNFEITTFTNLKTRITSVIIKKDNTIVYENNIQRAPFAIDYAAIIETL